MAPSEKKTGPTVLIVEDDSVIRETLGEILASEGYRVLYASDGADALERLRRGIHPGLILLDLMMPVMNGWEFRLEQMRDPRLAAIPVIVVTGALQHPEPLNVLRVEALLPKPVDVPRLLEAVARYSAPQP
jgi:CheY-like chemotaxis protein